MQSGFHSIEFKTAAMNISFSKYHGAGNDFIIVDARKFAFPDTPSHIAFLCDRHKGIGADGLMLLEEDKQYDFRMRYFNADGKEGSLCGNGGRCIVAFAHQLGLIQSECSFMAVDGAHYAKVSKNDESFFVELKMQDLILPQEDQLQFLDTGSPHHVEWLESWDDVNVHEQGRVIRYSEKYASIHGTNVNFVRELSHAHLEIRYL